MAEDIWQWLEDLGLGKYGDVFVENGIDVDVLSDLANDDLKDIGINLGDRKRLMRAIDQLDGGYVSPANNETAYKPEQHSTAAERRQLTIMFCDLVGSTALSRELDPEDLREVIGCYQDAVAAAVACYDGHVAKYLGDGVLAYFGWPQAYEDQAERAVRAGLDAVEAVSVLKGTDNHHLEARVGIATGEVVVGDLVGRSGIDAEAVVGETPNMAARLQQVAQPGEIVISHTTRHLLNQTFDVANLGEHSLKGFDGATQVWCVKEERASNSRFQATHAGFVTPMVGRDQELSQLLALWGRACLGEGQVAVLCGEAGIGKSRLAAAIVDEFKGQDHFCVRYQCSPFHLTSAFYPAVQQLTHAARISANDSEEEKLDKLEFLLSKSHSHNAQNHALFADLLSLQHASRFGALELSAQQIKQATMQALCTEMELLARSKPVLFLFEDTHWIDPTSLELLNLLIGGIRQSRVLIVVTHRPEWRLHAENMPHLSTLTLDRLSRDADADIARAIAGEEIDAEVVDLIVSRTDGVPLFVEELTKTLLESGFETTKSNVPVTLQASLLARLDRLGPAAKEVAQIGAAIGRDFDYDLLAEVAGRPTTGLDGELDRLVSSELVFRRGTPSRVSFNFKHALVQDAIYGTLLKSRRQEIHGEIAQTLEVNFSARVENQPELLAHHFTNAGMVDEAIAYWRQAAAMAISRSAYREALNHFTAALELLQRQSETKERDRLELDIRVAQGVVCIATTGYSSPAVEEIYLRARQLCADLGDLQRIFPVLRGLWNLYVDRADLITALEYAQNLVAQAELEKNLERVALANRALGFTCVLLAQSQEAHKALTRGVAAMTEQGKPADLRQYGEDGGLASQQYLAWNTLFLGDPAGAIELARSSVVAADRLDHAVSRAFARGNAATLYSMCEDIDQVLRITGEMLEISESHGLIFWQAHALRNRGWAMGHRGCISEGLQMLEEGDALWLGSGALVMRTMHHYLVAELHGLAGDIELGLAATQKGLQLVKKHNDHWYHAELVRMEGWLRQQNGQKDQALKLFGQAIQIARQQQNAWWLLRAAKSKAALLLDIGDYQAARELLLPIYGQFSKGAGFKDLTEARSLLKALA
jgi:class 3 adenylate cyclase/tetratricopeptide (TPR) repeat protein